MIFPTVSVNFAGGASMILKPEDYFLQQTSIGGAAVWCIGFQKIKGQGITILGDLVLKDKIVVYDLAGQWIGWANYDCSLTVNVSATTSTESQLLSPSSLTHFSTTASAIRRRESIVASLPSLSHHSSTTTSAILLPSPPFDD
ncbi:hypothetical protein TEA_022617 [Camellia sinensis var. sinensis]|uniref:Peptidase A1 domain-containing protein n=1 Tax=Camellia sinensis var. sinensis TaxID=542762 RepID=A0A4S4DQE1_CAMSN|nr:hypothetical protein TEA_022617 [Camellia sinensis var. sinensis]